MQDFLKKVLPVKVRKFLRPAAIRYQRMTEGQNQKNLFGDFIAPGDLVFDIGANTGRMTQIFLNHGARVVAVEPQAKCHRELEKKYLHNKRVVLIEAGVSNTSGIETLNICEDVDEVSSFDKNWETCHHAANWSGQVSVRMTTLDILIATFGLPAYCKIDVEGYEENVLSGLSVPIPYLSFEMHRHHLPAAKACIAKLNQLGNYVFNFAPHQSQKLQAPGWHDGSTLLMWITDSGWTSGDVFCKLV